ncbi:MAG: hypothetical protein GF320_20425, partial [Armatimonadia bacterium]|nr:hypothetical protein [Armatimonadia bacterium]
MMTAILLVAAMAVGQAASDNARVLWERELDRAGDLQGLELNGEITPWEATSDGLIMETPGADPIIYLPEFALATSPYQALEITYECSGEGRGEIFYAHDRNTEYGGFSGAKRIEVGFEETDEPTKLTVWPFWIEAPELIQVRIDPPSGVRLTLHAVRILEARVDPAEWTGELAGPADALNPLSGAEIAGDSLVATGGRVLLASSHIGPLSPLTPWLRTDWSRDTEGATWEAAVVGPAASSAEWRAIEPQPGGTANTWLPGASTWLDGRGVVVLRSTESLDAGSRLPISALALSPEPSGKPHPTVVFLGSDDPMPRAGTEEAVLLRLGNIASAPIGGLSAFLTLPDGLELLDGSLRADLAGTLVHGDVRDLRWPVRAAAPGDYPVSVRLLGDELDVSEEAVLRITEGPTGLTPGRVPEPEPLETDYDIGVYYFPGWNTRSSWEVLDLFAEREPVLGYYREGLPEIVDWQILWAAERGVRFFAYDWYWDRGAQMLDHGIKAYLESEYREYLDFCLLWANHN